ncbi:MAG TPA: protein TolR [Elusimicrobia bacterium]|nr:protein TolR [Elusimicrobiota bacterium]HBT61987.1 protein TolR [Elusimicrobiota bacterium]
MKTSGVEGEPISAINVTPLVDVALVLVIVFMITLPFVMEKAVKVRSGHAKPVALSAATQPILIELSTGSIRLEGRPIAAEQLGNELRAVMESRGVTAVAVSAQRDVEHGRVIEVLDLAAIAGASELDVLEPMEESHGSS